MKKLIQRLQPFGEKAAQVQHALETATQRAAELRESVAVATGTFQQLRGDVEKSVQGLRADTEEQLVQTLRDVQEAVPVLRQAGFELRGVDIELGLNRRLLIHLERGEDVQAAFLRQLIAENLSHRTIHGLLTALLEAGELAEKIHLGDLQYCELILGIGVSTSARLCWRSTRSESEFLASAAATRSSLLAPPCPPQPPVWESELPPSHKAAISKPGACPRRGLDPSPAPTRRSPPRPQLHTPHP